MRNKFYRRLTLLLSCIYIYGGNNFAAVAPRPQYSLAVLPFEASGRVSAEEAAILTTRLYAELEKIGVFILSPESAVQSTLQNAGLVGGGCASLDCGVQVGKMLATQLVVTGSVRKVGQLFFVETQMIHVKSGKVVERANEDFDGDFTALQERMAAVARKLVGNRAETQMAAVETPVQAISTSEQNEANITIDTNSDTSNEAPANTTEVRSGGNKILVYGLVAVGAVGAAVGITQLTKGAKNNNVPSGNTNNLPNPPSFP